MKVDSLGECEKVVLRYGSEVIKGYLEPGGAFGTRDGHSANPVGTYESIRIQRAGSESSEELPTQNVKAIFYVRNFEGDSEHEALHFYTQAPTADGIWLRIEFTDGEVMEGIVENGVRYLVDPGFYLRPTDPQDNNELVYVFKNWIKDHRVLGLRSLPQMSSASDRLEEVQ